MKEPDDYQGAAHDAGVYLISGNVIMRSDMRVLRVLRIAAIIKFVMASSLVLVTNHRAEAFAFAPQEAKNSEFTPSANDSSTRFDKVWDMTADYSGQSNPNGVWSYGRKWSPDNKGFDLLTVKWGASGWYMGNWGHGGPSIQSGPGLWAKNNSNGLPVVRWTCPEEGWYQLATEFIGGDSRGVDVTAYVALNDSVIFNSIISANGETRQFQLPRIHLNKNDRFDFLIRWNGNIYYEYSWTAVRGTISRFGNGRFISIPDTSILSNSTLKLPLRIDRADSLIRIQGKVKVDSGSIRILKLELGSLAANFRLTDTLFADHASFVLAGAKPMQGGPGDLLSITLKAQSAAVPGDTCSISLTDVLCMKEMDTVVPVFVKGGKLSIIGKEQIVIKPDTLELKPRQSQLLKVFLQSPTGQLVASSASWSVEPLAEIGKTRVIGKLTAANGSQTTFSAIRIGDGRVIALNGDKSDTAWVCVQGLPGDVTADSLIMANDATQTLRAAVGLSLAPLPPGHNRLTLYERFAADMNQNGIINVDDAKMILDKSLEGLLCKTTVESGIGPAMICIGPARNISGSSWYLPLYLKGRVDIAAAKIELSFNDAIISVREATPAAVGTIRACNDAVPGKIILAMIHSERLTAENDELLQLQIISRGERLQSAISVGRVELFDTMGLPVTVSVAAQESAVPAMPQDFILEQNFPNPFNSSTAIRCRLARESHVKLEIYNSSGQMVKMLLDGVQPAGVLLTEWDGRDTEGRTLGSGIYFCRLATDCIACLKHTKIMLLK